MKDTPISVRLPPLKSLKLKAGNEKLCVGAASVPGNYAAYVEISNEFTNWVFFLTRKQLEKVINKLMDIECETECEK